MNALRGVNARGEIVIIHIHVLKSEKKITIFQQIVE